MYHYTNLIQHKVGIKSQTIRDSIHASKGKKVLKRGLFKGLILGTIS